MGKVKRILITGASGFIGSFMVERALDEGMEVWAAVRATSSRGYLRDGRIHFIELDLGDDARLRSRLEAQAVEAGAFDCVIHAAGATKCRRPDDFFRINTDGTARLARLLVETGALRPGGRFVFISSLSVHGATHEKDRRPIRENEPKCPDTAYGLSKLKAEQRLGEVEGLNYVVLRPTGVYGPRERDYYLMAQSIRRHIDFAVGFRPQVLTFIYVADLVEAAFLALRYGMTGRAYILSDGGTYTSRSFSDLLQLELGVKRVMHIVAPLWVLYLVCKAGGAWGKLRGKVSTLNPDKYHIMRQRNWRCDIGAARKELGYAPKWPLTRGVKAAVEWYKAEGWL